MIRKNKIKRVLVLGSSSFIAKSVIDYLKLNQVKIIEISRKKINFHDKSSIRKLKNLVKNGDIIFFAAAKAPVKSYMFNYNLKILENIVESLKNIKISKLVYLSSDAVYTDSLKPINENSSCEPVSLHGLMHLTREKYLESVYANKLCVVTNFSLWYK